MANDERRELAALEAAARWDVEHPDGEGEVQATELDPGGLFQWVQVVHNNRVLGTFSVVSRDGEPVELSLIVPRKGLPPNPFVEGEAAFNPWLSWRASGQWALGRFSELSGVDFPDDVRATQPELRRAAWRAQQPGAPGQRGITGVRIEPSQDGDPRFKFVAGGDSFTVRGSKLAPVLFKFRCAGVQRVDLGQVRRALELSR